MSAANEIADTAVAVLISANVAAGRITRSLEEGYSYDDFPVVLLHLVADVPGGQPAPVGIEYRQLTLELEILADGDVPHAACDAVHAAANAALLALPYPVQRGAVQWDYDEENPALGICRAQYQISYRRREGEL